MPVIHSVSFWSLDPSIIFFRSFTGKEETALDAKELVHLYIQNPKGTIVIKDGIYWLVYPFDNVLVVSHIDSEAQLEALYAVEHLCTGLKALISSQNLTAVDIRKVYPSYILAIDQALCRGGPSTIEKGLLLSCIGVEDYNRQAKEALKDATNDVWEMAKDWMGVEKKSQIPALRGQQEGSIVKMRVGSGSGVGLNTGMTMCGSSIWWRSNLPPPKENNLLIDVVERFSCVYDKGRPMKFSITGNVYVESKLGEFPLVLMHLNSPKVLKNAGFHSAVNQKKWEEENILQFVPENSMSCIANYYIADEHIGSRVPMMVDGVMEPSDLTRNTYCFRVTAKGSLSTVGENRALSDIQVCQVENAEVQIELFKGCRNIQLETATGAATVENGKTSVNWKIGQVPYGCHPSCSIYFQYDGNINLRPRIVAYGKFCVFETTITGLEVVSVDVEQVSYKDPFCGCRMSTHHGNCEYWI